MQIPQFPYKVQASVLDQALQLVGYMPVANAALAVIDAQEGIPADSKVAIRAMAYWMPGNIQMTGGDIIQTVMTIPWTMIGLPDAPALGTEQRETVVAVIMAVSKQVIANEAARLVAITQTDTTIVPPPEDPEPTEGEE